MKNIISTRLPGIIAQASYALPAVNRYAASLGLTHVTGMGERLQALITAREAARLAQVTLAGKRRILRELFHKARRHISAGREVLRFHVGSAPTLEMAQAGFEGSLAIPRSVEPLIAMLHRMAGYLEKHPAHQNTGMNVTAAVTKDLWTQMMAALVAVNQQRARVTQWIKDRDAKAQLVRKDLRTLYAELKIALDPMDSIFEEFGFKRPGWVQTPEVPEEVTVELVNPTAAVVKVQVPARARRFRFWQKIAGVDEDFVLIDSRRMPDCILEDLPPHTEIELAVSASNKGGESGRSKVAVIKTGAAT